MPALPRATLTLALALLAACNAPAGNRSTVTQSNRLVPVIGNSCEGCEAIFDGLPADIPSQIRLAPAGEPGVPMRITGRVLDDSGRARAGVVVYAYQTDSTGIYPRPTQRLGREAMRHGVCVAGCAAMRRDATPSTPSDPEATPGRTSPNTSTCTC